MLQRLQHRIRERFGTGNILRPQHVRNIWSQAHFLEKNVQGLPSPGRCHRTRHPLCRQLRQSLPDMREHLRDDTLLKLIEDLPVYAHPLRKLLSQRDIRIHGLDAIGQRKPYGGDYPFRLTHRIMHPPLNLLVGLDDEFDGVCQRPVKVQYHKSYHIAKIILFPYLCTAWTSLYLL